MTPSAPLVRRAAPWLLLLLGGLVPGCGVGSAAAPDGSAPLVIFTSPTAGAEVGAVVNIAIAAQDNVGVTAVRLFIDNTLFGEDINSPYTFVWNTFGVPDGSPHTLRAEARDAAGNTGTVQISVTVRNAPN